MAIQKPVHNIIHKKNKAYACGGIYNCLTILFFKIKNASIFRAIKI